MTLASAGRRALERALPLWEDAQAEMRERLAAQGGDALTRGMLNLAAFAR